MRRPFYKRILKWIGLVLFNLFVVLIVLEIVYRYQWIDFYKNEIEALNQGKSDLPNILFFGDSFGAQKNSYVDQLRMKVDGYNMVNASIPGTCALQAAYVAKGRINAFKPEKIIFQVYIGNDLLDAKFPINWNELSWTRNTFWWLAERFRVLSFFNYKLAQLSSVVAGDNLEAIDTKTSEGFSIQKYSPRTKLLIKARPEYIYNAVNLPNSSLEKSAIKKLIIAYKSIIERLDMTTDFFFLVIPHCAQVGGEYYQNFQALNAKLGENLLANDYPFLRAIKDEFGPEKVLNPLKLLKEAELEGVKCYYANDPHLTKEGHGVIAKFLKNKLE